MVGLVTMLDTILASVKPQSSARQPAYGEAALPISPSGVGEALSRGLAMRCAACGSGRMFQTFLQPVKTCADCGVDWRQRTADDFPPYLVILLVGHIVAPALIFTEITWQPPVWVQLSIWLPLVALLALGLMQPVKGAVMAFQWWHWDFDKSQQPGIASSHNPSAPAAKDADGLPDAALTQAASKALAR